MTSNGNMHKVAAIAYPKGHFGQIWKYPGRDDIWPWELILCQHHGDRKVANGLATSYSAAFENLQGVWEVWSRSTEGISYTNYPRNEEHDGKKVQRLPVGFVAF